MLRPHLQMPICESDLGSIGATRTGRFKGTNNESQIFGQIPPFSADQSISRVAGAHNIMEDLCAGVA